VADHLAAGADHISDLVHIDLDLDDSRCVLRDVVSSLADGLRHAVEELQPTNAGLLHRFFEDLAAEAFDLDVHLQCGDALGRTCDLEVHVTVVVFLAGDVGEDAVAVTLRHQTHRDSGDRALEGHTGVHHRH